MKCHCGYDNTPLPGNPAPTHCEGCGTRISGGEKPFPGIRLDPEGYDEHEQTEPIVVTDDLRDRLREDYPHVDDERIDSLLVIKESTYHWGNGLGAAPDGYARDTLVVVREDEDGCPECGCTEVEQRESHDCAGIASTYTTTCTRCEHTIEEHFSC